MRSLVLLVLVAGCAGRETAWTTLAPGDLDEGKQAFVLVDSTALHIANVQYVDDRLQGRVIHAWALPVAGVAALADNSTSPEQIARHAGWPELPLARAHLDVPISAVRSARGIVDVEPDPEEAPSDGAMVAAAIATGVLEALLDTPRCCHLCR